MQKWMHALMLGMEILDDIQKMLMGQATSFSFIWGNRSFTVSFTPIPAPPPPTG
jgi:hypothetical protein